MRYVLLALMILGIGCGGGGGGSDDGGEDRSGEFGSFAGTWSASLFLTNNDCPVDVADLLEEVHQINQDGINVVINNPAINRTYAGTTVEGGNAFVVTNSNVPEGCTGVDGYRYEAVEEGHAVITRALDINCGGISCTTIYQGTSDRR